MYSITENYLVYNDGTTPPGLYPNLKVKTFRSRKYISADNSTFYKVVQVDDTLLGEMELKYEIVPTNNRFGYLRFLAYNGNYYELRHNDGGIKLYKNNNLVQSSTKILTNDTRYAVKVVVEDMYIKVKIWNLGGVEPEDFDIDTLRTSEMSFGRIIFSIYKTMLGYISLNYKNLLGGRGTETDPFQINNADDFDIINKFPRYHYLQVNDIDLIEKIGAGGWVSVQAPDIYDGGGFNISNLHFRSDGRSLFTSSYSAWKTIRNVNITSMLADNTNCYVLYHGYYNIRIEDCTVNLSVNSSVNVNIAGIMEITVNGYADAVFIERCKVTANDVSMAAGGRLYGIAGFSYANVKDCVTEFNCKFESDVEIYGIGLSTQLIETCKTKLDVKTKGSVYGIGSNAKRCFVEGVVEAKIAYGIGSYAEECKTDIGFINHIEGSIVYGIGNDAKKCINYNDISSIDIIYGIGHSAEGCENRGNLNARHIAYGIGKYAKRSRNVGRIAYIGGRVIVGNYGEAFVKGIGDGAVECENDGDVIGYVSSSDCVQAEGVGVISSASDGYPTVRCVNRGYVKGKRAYGIGRGGSSFRKAVECLNTGIVEGLEAGAGIGSSERCVNAAVEIKRINPSDITKTDFSRVGSSSGKSVDCAMPLGIIVEDDINGIHGKTITFLESMIAETYEDLGWTFRHVGV